MMTPSAEQQANPTPTSLAVVQGFDRLALEPKDFEGAWRMATIAAARNLCDVKTAEEAFIRIAAGRELGLTTFQSLRLVYVVKNRPSLDASLMLSLCLNHPQCEFFDVVETTAAIATFVAKRRGRPEVKLSWTIEQADKAGLLAKGKDKDDKDWEKGSWHTYPDAMLRARCIAALARIVFPDALNGILAREELIGDDVVGPIAPPTIAVTRQQHTNQTIVEMVAEPVATEPAQPPIPQAPTRDFAAEVAGLKQAIADAKSDDDRKAVRAAIKAFGNDGGSPFVDELKRLYEMVHAAPSAPATQGA